MKFVDVLKMKRVVLVFLCCWLVSCGNDNTVSIPDNVLSKEKMAKIMTDMHLLEASMNLNISNAVATDQTPDMDSKVRSVFKKNNVTKEEYETSFVFYTAHTELLSEIYTEVLTDLSKLQAKVSNEKAPDPKNVLPVKDKEQSKKDSIEKASKAHPKMDPIKRPANRIDPLKSFHNKKKK